MKLRKVYFSKFAIIVGAITSLIFQNTWSSANAEGPQTQNLVFFTLCIGIFLAVGAVVGYVTGGLTSDILGKFNVTNAVFIEILSSIITALIVVFFMMWVLV